MNEPNDAPLLSSKLAKWGMAAALLAFALLILFNPDWGFVLAMLPQSAWPGAIRVVGIAILILLPVAFILSSIGLVGLGRHGYKGILIPGLAGLLISLVLGVPFNAAFIRARFHSKAQREMVTESTVSFPVLTPTTVKATPSKAVGAFIPAPYRSDMVHDSKRNILYITASDSVLRYQMTSNKFLEPLALGGDLRGIDISPDNDLLAVADATDNNGSIGIYLVDLKTGQSSHATFRAENQEGGTYSVAFGADGGVWITSSFHGSGWVPLRKYDPVSRHTLVTRHVRQDTMLAASTDRQTIAYAEGDISSGDYGRFGCRATQIPQSLQANAFLYEIGISRDGKQLAVPNYGNIALSGAAVQKLDESETIGVAYHPQRDFVFLAQAGTAAIAVYETANYTKVKQLDFGEKFDWTGNHAFQRGRLRLSGDGMWLFCTVNGGVRYAETGL